MKNEFNELRSLILENFEDISTPGLFNPEELRGNKIATFKMFDGGYTQIIKSEKFKFLINDDYKGTVLQKGKLESVHECINYLKEKL